MTMVYRIIVLLLYHKYYYYLILFGLITTSIIASDSPIRVFGKSISEQFSLSNGTRAERVIIYPQESYDSEKTITRHGILVSHPQACATVLVCHGFMCDKYDAG